MKQLILKFANIDKMQVGDHFFYSTCLNNQASGTIIRGAFFFSSRKISEKHKQGSVALRSKPVVFFAIVASV